MKKPSLAILAATGAAIAAAVALAPADHASAANECGTENAIDDIERAEAEALYDCAIDGLVAGWSQAGHPVATAYRDWTAASTWAAATGTHGNRFLFTYVNDAGKDAYLAFAEENVDMPVGSILAKESFTIGKKGDKKGKVQSGPLFLMEKVAAGTFDETDNWKYTLITPKGIAWIESGKTEPAKIAKFCHDCHSAVGEDQDFLYYPDEDARVASN